MQATVHDYEGRHHRLGAPGARPHITSVKETKAERLKFVGAPVFEPEPFLPRHTAAAFANPSVLHLLPEETPPPPRVFHRQSDSETFAIDGLLDQSGRLGLCLADESAPPYRAVSVASRMTTQRTG